MMPGKVRSALLEQMSEEAKREREVRCAAACDCKLKAEEALYAIVHCSRRLLHQSGLLVT
jgi:hypothetical protein